MQKKIISLTISAEKLLETIRTIAPHCATKEALLTSIAHHNQKLQVQIISAEEKVASYKRRLGIARAYVSDQSMLVSQRSQKKEREAALEIEKKVALSKTMEMQGAHAELLRINKEMAPLKETALVHEVEIGNYKLWAQNEARKNLQKALPLCDQDEFLLLEEVNTVLDEATQLKLTKALASAMDDTDLLEPTSPQECIKSLRGVIVEKREKRQTDKKTLGAALIAIDIEMEAHIRQTDYSLSADFSKATLRKIEAALTNNSWELPKDMDRVSVDFKPFEIMVRAMRERMKIIETMSTLHSVQTRLSPLLASCKAQKLICEGLKQGSLQLESALKSVQVEIDRLTKSIAEQEALVLKQNLEKEKLIKELSNKLSKKQTELTVLKSQLVSEEMIHFCEDLNFSLIYPNRFLQPTKPLEAALSVHQNPQALIEPSRPELTAEEQEALQVLSRKNLPLDVPILILSFQTEAHHSNTVWCLTDKDSLRSIQTFRTDFPTQDEADLAGKTVVLLNPTAETMGQMKHEHFYVIGPKENLEALERQAWKGDLECTKDKPQNGMVMMRVSPFSLREKIKTTVNSCVRYGIYTMAALMVLLALLAYIQNQAKNES